jgi:hypothetical protein
VTEWATGYTRWLAHLGYNPQSAHPWALDDLRKVLEHLDARIASTTGFSLLLLHRDAFTMTILWETCSRGATAVSWCLEDLWLASGEWTSSPFFFFFFFFLLNKLPGGAFPPLIFSKFTCSHTLSTPLFPLVVHYSLHLPFLP